MTSRVFSLTTMMSSPDEDGIEDPSFFFINTYLCPSSSSNPYILTNFQLWVRVSLFQFQYGQYVQQIYESIHVSPSLMSSEIETQPYSTTTSLVRAHISSFLPSKLACTPQPVNMIAPSVFWPFVSADRWVLMWTTPHSEYAQSHLDAELPFTLQRYLFSCPYLMTHAPYMELVCFVSINSVTNIAFQRGVECLLHTFFFLHLLLKPVVQSVGRQLEIGSTGYVSGIYLITQSGTAVIPGFHLWKKQLTKRISSSENCHKIQSLLSTCMHCRRFWIYQNLYMQPYGQLQWLLSGHAGILAMIGWFSFQAWNLLIWCYQPLYKHGKDSCGGTTARGSALSKQVGQSGLQNTR